VSVLVVIFLWGLGCNFYAHLHLLPPSKVFYSQKKLTVLKKRNMTEKKFELAMNLKKEIAKIENNASSVVQLFNDSKKDHYISFFFNRKHGKITLVVGNTEIELINSLIQYTPEILIADYLQQCEDRIRVINTEFDRI
jgi:hypothetical protein